MSPGLRNKSLFTNGCRDTHFSLVTNPKSALDGHTELCKVPTQAIASHNSSRARHQSTTQRFAILLTVGSAGSDHISWPHSQHHRERVVPPSSVAVLSHGSAPKSPSSSGGKLFICKALWNISGLLKNSKQLPGLSSKWVRTTLPL